MEFSPLHTYIHTYVHIYIHTEGCEHNGANACVSPLMDSEGREIKSNRANFIHSDGLQALINPGNTREKAGTGLNLLREIINPRVSPLRFSRNLYPCKILTTLLRANKNML